MSRSSARKAAWVLFASFVLFSVLAQLCQLDVLAGVGIASLIAMAVIVLAFDRCPHCRAYTGRAAGSYCPYCGELLTEEKKP